MASHMSFSQSQFILSSEMNMKPETALSFFKAKGLKMSFGWEDMIAEEHAKSFTVAKMMDLDLLADTQRLVDKALESGQTMNWVRERIIPYWKAKGWVGKKDAIDPKTGKLVRVQLGSSSRLKTIFRTNMQASYSVGAWEMIQQQKNDSPYLIYDAVDDHRTRSEHKSHDGKVYPADHPFWDSWFPPNGWGCRCTTIQVTKAQAEKFGYEISEPPKQMYFKWTNPRTGKVHKVPEGIDPGWDYNPGKAGWKQLYRLQIEKIGAMPHSIQKAALEGVAATVNILAKRRKNPGEDSD
ncbi:MAG: phage minor head protein [Sedimenticola sp.]